MKTKTVTSKSMAKWAVLMLMALAVTLPAGADNPTWLKSGDTWDATTKTLTVNSDLKYQAYMDCTEIEHLVVSSGISHIGEETFYGCTSLKSVILPSTLKTIWDYAFGNCTLLESVILPSGLSQIFDNAFNNCTSLKSITIPYKTSIETSLSVFANCTNLETVIILSYYNCKIRDNFYGVNSSCHFYVRSASAITDYDKYKDQITVVSGVRTVAGAMATTTATPFVSDNGTDYYASGAQFTIGHSETPPNGYAGTFKGYKVTDVSGTDITTTAINGTTLTLPEGTVTVRALFDIVNYSITYELDGGSIEIGVGNEIYPTTYTVETPTITLPDIIIKTMMPQKAYCDFIGWTGPGYDEPTKDVKIPQGSYGDRTYTANWRLKEYDITYDLAGGALPEGVTNPASYNYETETFTLNNPTREGYYFIGWTGNNGNTPEKTVTITQGTSNGEKSYTANWAYLLTDITDANVSEIADKPVALQRTFTKGKPMTICLPFAPDALLDEGSMWEFTGIRTDHKAVMSQLTSGLQANKPYIFIPESSFEGTVWGTAASSIDLDPKTVDGTAGFTFHGAYSKKHWDDTSDEVINGTIYGFMVEDNDGQQLGQFVRARRATNLRAFSCYLEYNGEALNGILSTRGEEDLPDVIGIMWLSADGDATGIEINNCELISNNRWYTLDGRRLSGKPTKKGLYIQNCRKVVIK